jgi:formylglycine-generating enzyme required for sulfatase activity
MAGKIFINYRRGESLKDAQLLATLLDKPFGAKQIFLDVHGIDGGANWLHTIEQQVGSSDAMVALIEKGWADRRDEAGNRRLDNPDDFVRFEIAQALQRNIPVLPVLLDGAPMPKASELPAQMLALTLFQAMPMRAESVARDAEAIAQRLRALLAQRREHGLPGWMLGAGAAVLLAVGVAGGPFVLSQLRLPLPGVSLPSEGQGARQELQRQLEAAKAEARQAQQQSDKAAQDLAQAQKDLQAVKATLAAALRERDDARADLTKAGTQIADLQRQIDAAKSDTKKAQEQLAKAVQDLEQAQKDREASKEALAAARREGDAAHRDLATALAKVADLQKELDATKDALAKALRQAGGDPALAVTAGSGQSFRDWTAGWEPCPQCPEMVVVPGGNFTMGSPKSEQGRSDEGPQHQVTIAKPFAVGKFAVKRSEFAAFVGETGYKTEGGCNRFISKWELVQDRSWRLPPSFQQNESHPVVCVDWDDAKAFVAWLSKKTGKPYRLLSEAEWEYAARAGTTTKYYFGDDDNDFCRYGNVADQTGKKSASDWTALSCNDGYTYTAPVGSFSPNKFGLYDMLGNARQWVEDCYHASYEGAPADGSAWTLGDCNRRVLRGSAWNTTPAGIRTANRNWSKTDFRTYTQTLRVARTLAP